MKKKSILIIALTVLLCAAVITLLVIKKPWDKSGGEETTAPSVSESDTTLTTQPTETTADTEPSVPSLADELIGVWTDSTGLSGYEFFPDGRVSWKYIDLLIPVVNFPVKGAVSGTYTLTGDRLKVSFSIYSYRFTHEYTTTIKDNELTLFEIGDGSISTYQRAGGGSSLDISAYSPELRDELIGAWTSVDGTTGYTFNQDGTLSVALKDAVLPGRGDALSGTAGGVYFLQNDALTMQFSLNDETVTVEATCGVEHNSMRLTAADGAATLFSRNGTMPDELTAPESLRGTWKTADGSVSYTFNEGNVMKVVYDECTVPALDRPISGTYAGTYFLEGSNLRLIYTAYNTPITENWTVSQQEDGSLVMVDTSSAASRTLTK